MSKPKLSAERARELFSYDPETGELRWKVSRGRAKVGDVAGYPQPDGYRKMSIDWSPQLAHRVVWLITHGTWPEGEIDHINGDPSDNRLVNLRDVTCRANQQNQRAPHKGSKSGVLGVSVTEGGRCLARISVEGVRRALGTFDTPQEAHQAYLTAKRELHAGCTI